MQVGVNKLLIVSCWDWNSIYQQLQLFASCFDKAENRMTPVKLVQVQQKRKGEGRHPRSVKMVSNASKNGILNFRTEYVDLLFFVVEEVEYLGRNCGKLSPIT